MKKFGKVLVLGFACGLVATLFTACGPTVNGTTPHQSTNDKINTVITTPINEHTEVPVNEPVEEPVKEPTQKPTEEPTQEPTEEPNDTPEAPACQHELGTWIVDIPATCTTPGTKHRTCTCGEVTESDEIPALGHNFNQSTHHCNREGCDEYQAPIENLAGSYWECKDFGIYFTPDGDCYTYNCDKAFEPNGDYSGTYNVITQESETEIQYFVKFKTTMQAPNGLVYTATTHDGKTVYTLYNEGYLFGKFYKDCTLTFKGYEVQ